MDRRLFLRASGTGLAALLPARLGLERVLDGLAALPRAKRLNPHRLRAEYMLDPGLLYLNHGSIGTIPRAVHEARVRYLEACETNPHVHIWEDGFTDALAATRSKMARLLGCATEEVAFTHNTTEGFNVLAQGLGLGAGDEVLFSSLNHASASQPWRHYAERYGYAVRQFQLPIERVPALTEDDVVALHAEQIRPSTRVLVFPEVDNIVGLRHPVARLAARARELGVTFVAVDGAQVLGMLPVDVAAVDFYAASPHKWLQAPKGSGVLYVKRAMQQRLSPMWVKRVRSAIPPTAEAFEDYSTRNLPEVVTLSDAIDFQTALGPAEKSRRYMEIRRSFRDAVRDDARLRWCSAERETLSASLFAIEPVGRDARAVQRALTAAGVVVRAFGPPLNTLRVSPNLVHVPEDLTRLMAAIAAA